MSKNVDVATPVGPPPLRTYQQAAEWLGVSYRWLERRVAAGQVPYTRLGQHVRFSQAQLDAIVASHAVQVAEPVAAVDQPAPARSLRDIKPKGGRRAS